MPARTVVLGAVTALALAGSLPATPAFAARKRATRMTSSSPANVVTGASVVVSGRLRSARGPGLRRQSVGLYWAGTGRRYTRVTVTRTKSGGRYRFSVKFASPGSGRLAVWFHGTRRWRASHSVRRVMVTQAAPSQPPAPAPPPATPPPPTSAPTLPPDPTTVTAYPMSEAPEGISPGSEDCNFGSIGRTSPWINGPTGRWVYAINKLFDTPATTNQWRLDQSSDWFYNGTYRPVFDWYDMNTNQLTLSTSDMNLWYMNSGWAASVVQYVWDAGVWYDSVGAVCVF